MPYLCVKMVCEYCLFSHFAHRAHKSATNFIASKDTWYYPLLIDKIKKLALLWAHGYNQGQSP